MRKERRFAADLQILQGERAEGMAQRTALPHTPQGWVPSPGLQKWRP